MLTYSFENRGQDSLYEYLYKRIKEDILTGVLPSGEKLPSKRNLAKNLNISTITVENAYNQLIAEGYIFSIMKKGFYVSDITSQTPIAQNRPIRIHSTAEVKTPYFADFTDNSTLSKSFPFAIWNKLTRLTMSDYAEDLMVRSPSGGILLLREAIADYLYQFRGMAVAPEQIVVGAGTEYLYSLIIQLLGRDKTYAVEDPGYQKITHIYEANDVTCVHIPIDEYGINSTVLNESEADILHLSPSHHFPTGIVTPINRRYELLAWANACKNRYIIEDDYDSEFRLVGKPIPALQSIDTTGKVIYMNTFSKSLSSTIRISYMVLPKELSKKYNRELGFYSCTVSNFDQYTLYQFIERGHLEKHINRMRNHYRIQRDMILDCIRNHPHYPRVKIKEENAGLHFLLEIDTLCSDEILIRKAFEKGIKITCLSSFYHDSSNATEHTIIINYSGIQPERIPESIQLLFEGIFNDPICHTMS